MRVRQEQPALAGLAWEAEGSGGEEAPKSSFRAEQKESIPLPKD